MYTVYVIKSQNYEYTYTGFTNNLERRLYEHNLGKTKSNKKYTPFIILYTEQVPDRITARSRELFFKW